VAKMEIIHSLSSRRATRISIVFTVIIFSIIEYALAAGDLARNAVLHVFKLPTHWQL